MLMELSLWDVGRELLNSSISFSTTLEALKLCTLNLSRFEIGVEESLNCSRGVLQTLHFVRNSEQILAFTSKGFLIVLSVKTDCRSTELVFESLWCLDGEKHARAAGIDSKNLDSIELESHRPCLPKADHPPRAVDSVGDLISYCAASSSGLDTRGEGLIVYSLEQQRRISKLDIGIPELAQNDMNRVLCLKFSPDDCFLISAHQNGELLIHNARTAELVTAIQRGSSALDAMLFFHPRDRMLATVSKRRKSLRSEDLYVVDLVELDEFTVLYQSRMFMEEIVSIGFPSCSVGMKLDDTFETASTFDSAEICSPVGSFDSETDQASFILVICCQTAVYLYDYLKGDLLRHVSLDERLQNCCLSTFHVATSSVVGLSVCDDTVQVFRCAVKINEEETIDKGFTSHGSGSAASDNYPGELQDQLGFDSLKPSTERSVTPRSINEGGKLTDNPLKTETSQNHEVGHGIQKADDISTEWGNYLTEYFAVETQTKFRHSLLAVLNDHIREVVQGRKASMKQPLNVLQEARQSTYIEKAYFIAVFANTVDLFDSKTGCIDLGGCSTALQLIVDVLSSETVELSPHLLHRLVDLSLYLLKGFSPIILSCSRAQSLNSARRTIDIAREERVLKSKQCADSLKSLSKTLALQRLTKIIEEGKENTGHEAISLERDLNHLRQRIQQLVKEL